MQAKSSTEATNTIRVSLQADVRRYLPKGVQGPFTVSVAPGATVADLLAQLGIPDNDQCTVGVNGELAPRSRQLHANDDVAMWSPMEGG